MNHLKREIDYVGVLYRDKFRCSQSRFLTDPYLQWERIPTIFEIVGESRRTDVPVVQISERVAN